MTATAHVLTTPNPEESPAGPALLALARQTLRQVLVVDDDRSHAQAVARYLRGRGYETATAETAEQAVDLLRRHKFVAMICDVRLPGASGPAMLPSALALEPDLAVLMLSGADDARTARTVMACGALDYLVKPTPLADVAVALERALAERAGRIERARAERFVRDEVAARTIELEFERAALRAVTVGVAEALVHATEKKDVFLRGHSQRVSELGASIAQVLGLDVDTVETVRIAGRLHDVGKIGIREEVLNKPASLTAEEFAHVRSHVQIGIEILSPLTFLGAALDYVHHHHEHWDGSGYPQGLAGEEISLGGRILAAADAFDALTSRRPYREPLAPDAALQYLEGHSGTLLDPAVFAALERTVRRRKSLVFLEVTDVDDGPATHS